MPKAPKKPAVRPQKTKEKSSQSRGLLGYKDFSRSVFVFQKLHRRVYARTIFLLFAYSFVISGLDQQASYGDLSSSTEAVSGQLGAGALKLLVEVGALFTSVVTGSLTSVLDDSQRLYTGLGYLFAWLTVVWLTRHLLANQPIKVRDGLYNAGAPIIPTLLIGVFALLQLLPLALLTALVSALSNTGTINGLLLLPLTAALVALTVVSLYWLIGTFFAAIIATIPGTYPRAALKSAKELLSGYRRHVLGRVLWLVALLFVASFVLLTPVILFDALLGYPFAFIVTVWIMLVGSAMFVYGSTYIYMVYREVINERA